MTEKPGTYNLEEKIMTPDELRNAIALQVPHGNQKFYNKEVFGFLNEWSILSPKCVRLNKDNCWEVFIRYDTSTNSFGGWIPVWKNEDGCFCQSSSPIVIGFAFMDCNPLILGRKIPDFLRQNLVTLVKTFS